MPDGRGKTVARKWNEANCRSQLRALFLQSLACLGANTAAGTSNGVDFSQIPSQIKRNAADIDWQRDC
jgi:hypothetical protein